MNLMKVLSPEQQKKGMALIVSVCFLFSFIIAPSLQAAIESRVNIQQFKGLFDEMILPSNIGRITGARYCGSKKVVIDIQDLHCHAEVQKNIARILQLLDDKYKLKRVLVEGVAGQVDTSWLTDIKDEKQCKELAEALVADGRLTGSEYYSVLARRRTVLQGLEDDAIYRANFVRLAKILEKKETYGKIVTVMRNDLEGMQKAYYNRPNRKFETMIDRYRQGKLDGRKYYALLKRYAEKLNERNDNRIADIDIESYRNMNAYLSLTDEGKRLKYSNIARQLQEFMKVLKRKLPYTAYNYLLQKTDNFTKLDELYVYLAKMATAYRLDLSGAFPQLSDFFAYLEKGAKINPLAMVQEEQRLIAEIRTGLSQDQGEREVSFLTGFLGHFDDYLNNRLTAADYEYFEKHFDEFKTLWGKYAEENQLSALSGDFELLNTYYRTNEQRNQCFLKNMLGEYTNAGSVAPSDTVADVIASLNSAEDIVVVVAGGFHTEGIKEILKERNVSYLTVTPNVTGDTKTSDVVYVELAKQQARVLSQAFALRLLSALGDEEQVRELLKAELNITVQEHKDIVELAEKSLSALSRSGDITKMVDEWNSRFGEKFGTIAVESSGDEKTMAFVVRVKDKKQGTVRRSSVVFKFNNGKLEFKGQQFEKGVEEFEVNRLYENRGDRFAVIEKELDTLTNAVEGRESVKKNVEILKKMVKRARGNYELQLKKPAQERDEHGFDKGVIGDLMTVLYTIYDRTVATGISDEEYSRIFAVMRAAVEEIGQGRVDVPPAGEDVDEIYKNELKNIYPDFLEVSAGVKEKKQEIIVSRVEKLGFYRTMPEGRKIGSIRAQVSVVTREEFLAQQNGQATGEKDNGSSLTTERTRRFGQWLLDHGLRTVLQKVGKYPADRVTIEQDTAAIEQVVAPWIAVWDVFEHWTQIEFLHLPSTWYQRWGARGIIAVTLTAGGLAVLSMHALAIPLSLSMHLSIAGLSMYLAQGYTHMKYNRKYGTGTTANSPLTTGEPGVVDLRGGKNFKTLFVEIMQALQDEDYIAGIIAYDKIMTTPNLTEQQTELLKAKLTELEKLSRPDDYELKKYMQVGIIEGQVAEDTYQIFFDWNPATTRINKGRRDWISKEESLRRAREIYLQYYGPRQEKESADERFKKLQSELKKALATGDIETVKRIQGEVGSIREEELTGLNRYLRKQMSERAYRFSFWVERMVEALESRDITHAQDLLEDMEAILPAVLSGMKAFEALKVGNRTITDPAETVRKYREEIKGELTSQFWEAFRGGDAKEAELILEQLEKMGGDQYQLGKINGWKKLIVTLRAKTGVDVKIIVSKIKQFPNDIELDSETYTLLNRMELEDIVRLFEAEELADNNQYRLINVVAAEIGRNKRLFGDGKDINEENIRKARELIKPLLEKRPALKYLDVVLMAKMKHIVLFAKRDKQDMSVGMVSPEVIDAVAGILNKLPDELTRAVRERVKINLVDFISDNVLGAVGRNTISTVRVAVDKHRFGWNGFMFGFDIQQFEHTAFHELMHKVSLSSNVEGNPILSVDQWKEIAKAAGFAGYLEKEGTSLRFVSIDDFKGDYKELRQIDYGYWVIREDGGYKIYTTDGGMQWKDSSLAAKDKDNTTIYISIKMFGSNEEYSKTTPFEFVADAGAEWLSRGDEAKGDPFYGTVVDLLEKYIFQELGITGKEEDTNEFAVELLPEQGVLPKEKALRQIKALFPDTGEAALRDKVRGKNIVDLRGSGKEVILVGDLHARKDNLIKILNTNDNLGRIRRGEAVLVILGDAVHREERGQLEEMESSVEIMQFIMGLKLERPDNVYYILGNHDYLSGWFSKGGVFQGILYERQLKVLYGEEYVEQYKKFIKASPLVAIGDGFVAVHGGPIRDADEKAIDEADSSDENNGIVHDATWRRNGYVSDKSRYIEEDVQAFLERMGQRDGRLIVGHSPEGNTNWYWRPFDSEHHYVIVANHNNVGFVHFKNGEFNLVAAGNASPKIAKTENETGWGKGVIPLLKRQLLPRLKISEATYDDRIAPVVEEVIFNLVVNLIAPQVFVPLRVVFVLLHLSGWKTLDGKELVERTMLPSLMSVVVWGLVVSFNPLAAFLAGVLVHVLGNQLQPAVNAFLRSFSGLTLRKAVLGTVKNIFMPATAAVNSLPTDRKTQSMKRVMPPSVQNPEELNGVLNTWELNFPGWMGELTRTIEENYNGGNPLRRINVRLKEEVTPYNSYFPLLFDEAGYQTLSEIKDNEYVYLTLQEADGMQGESRFRVWVVKKSALGSIAFLNLFDINQGSGDVLFHLDLIMDFPGGKHKALPRINMKGISVNGQLENGNLVSPVVYDLVTILSKYFEGSQAYAEAINVKFLHMFRKYLGEAALDPDLNTGVRKPGSFGFWTATVPELGTRFPLSGEGNRVKLTIDSGKKEGNIAVALAKSNNIDGVILGGILKFWELNNGMWLGPLARQIEQRKNNGKSLKTINIVNTSITWNLQNSRFLYLLNESERKAFDEIGNDEYLIVNFLQPVYADGDRRSPRIEKYEYHTWIARKNALTEDRMYQDEKSISNSNDGVLLHWSFSVTPATEERRPHIEIENTSVSEELRGQKTVSTVRSGFISSLSEYFEDFAPEGMDNEKHRIVKNYDQLSDILTSWELSRPEWLESLEQVIIRDYNKKKPLGTINVRIKPGTSYRDYFSRSGMDKTGWETFQNTADDRYVYVTLLQPLVSKKNQIKNYVYSVAVVRKRSANRIPSLDALTVYNDTVNNDFLFKWDLGLTLNERTGQVHIKISQIAINKNLEGRKLISQVFERFKKILERNFWGSEVSGGFANEKALHLFQRLFDNAELIRERIKPSKELSWDNNETWSATVLPKRNDKHNGQFSEKWKKGVIPLIKRILLPRLGVSEATYDNRVAPVVEEVIFTGIPLGIGFMLPHVFLPLLVAARVLFVGLHWIDGKPLAEGNPGKELYARGVLSGIISVVVIGAALVNPVLALVAGMAVHLVVNPLASHGDAEKEGVELPNDELNTKNIIKIIENSPDTTRIDPEIMKYITNISLQDIPRIFTAEEMRGKEYPVLNVIAAAIGNHAMFGNDKHSFNEANIKAARELIQPLLATNPSLRYLNAILLAKEKHIVLAVEQNKQLRSVGELPIELIDAVTGILEELPGSLVRMIRKAVSLIFTDYLEGEEKAQSGAWTSDPVRVRYAAFQEPREKMYNIYFLTFMVYHEFMHKITMSSREVTDGNHLPATKDTTAPIPLNVPILQVSQWKELAKTAGFVGYLELKNERAHFVDIDKFTGSYRELREIGYGQWVFQENGKNYIYTKNGYEKIAEDYLKAYIAAGGKTLIEIKAKMSHEEYSKLTPFEFVANAGAHWLMNRSEAKFLPFYKEVATLLEKYLYENPYVKTEMDLIIKNREMNRMVDRINESPDSITKYAGLAEDFIESMTISDILPFFTMKSISDKDYPVLNVIAGEIGNHPMFGDSKSGFNETNIKTVRKLIQPFLSSHPSLQYLDKILYDKEKQIERGDEAQKEAVSIAGVTGRAEQNMIRRMNPMQWIRRVLKHGEKNAERYRGQDEALKGKAVVWIDRNREDADLRETVNNAARLQARGTNNVVVAQLKGITELYTPAWKRLPIKVTGSMGNPVKISGQFVTADNGEQVFVYFLHTGQEDFPAAAADLVDQLSTHERDTAMMREEFRKNGTFGNLDVDRIGMAVAAVVAEPDLLGKMQEEASLREYRTVLDTAFIAQETGRLRTGTAGQRAADARLDEVRVETAKDILTTIGAAARMKKKESEARGKYIIGSLDVTKMAKDNLAKSPQLLTADQAKNLAELVAELRKTAGSGDVRLTGLTAPLDGKNTQQRTALLKSLYGQIQRLNRQGLKLHGDYRMKGTDENEKGYVDQLLGTFDGLEIDLSKTSGWTKESLEAWVNSLGQRHAGKTITVNLPSGIDAKAMKTTLNENVLIISEDETDTGSNRLVKLKLKGRKKGDLKNVKATVIEVSLPDLAEYENDQFSEGDRQKLQSLEAQLGQIVTQAVRQNLQKVQQLFVETPAMVYDSALLYEEQDIPGIGAWEGMRQILEKAQFESLRQYFSGNVHTLKGVDGTTADNFAKAMEELVASGRIAGNTAAALKIRQLTRLVVTTTDSNEKTRYAGMLAMLGKGLSEKALLKYTVAETKTGEFQTAENNRLFGQLLLRKVLAQGGTPESLVRGLEDLGPTTAANETGFNDIREMLRQVVATGQLPSSQELGGYDAKRIGAYVDFTMEKFGGDVNAKKNGFQRLIEAVTRFFAPKKAAERQIEKDQYVKAATHVLSAMKDQGKEDSFDELLRILYLYSDRKVKTVIKEERIEVQTIQAMLGAA